MFEKIDKSEETLYHMVTDHYLASYLPVVGEVLPRLNIIPRNKQGKPYKDIGQTIIKQNENEYKVWQAISEYALSFEKSITGLPQLPAIYNKTQDRIVREESIPLFVWSYSLIGILLAGIFLLLRWRIKKSK